MPFEVVMPASYRSVGRWLRRRAENVASLLLATMFIAFMVQIVFRYFLNFPIGWTSELTIITWLWLVLWGAAFVVKEREEIRFDLIYHAVSARIRRAMAIVTALAIIVLYGFSLPAVVDYVTFMKVEATAYLKIRFDYLFSIYVIFALATIARYIWILWPQLRGKPMEEFDPSKVSSGL
jgi:TRAP-type C4-dicarboxylate transport system permease small subunit